MWDQAAVARAEERRCARGTAEVSARAEPLAGGWLCWDSPSSPTNAAVGVGLEGPPEPGDVDRIVAFYEQLEAPARIELPPTVDRAWLRALGAAGFALDRCENVFARELQTLPARPAPEGVELRPVRVDDDADVRRFAAVVGSGFCGPEGPSEDQLRFDERVARHPRTVALVALADGEVVAAGAAEAAAPVGGLFSLSVLPAWRRKGLQQALIAARLEALRERGCELATISCEPGVATERNAQRLGFALAYVRLSLVRGR
ncbi:MAG: GNAT family N-acetyltransferase [Myxococcota bacterium]